MRRPQPSIGNYAEEIVYVFAMTTSPFATTSPHSTGLRVKLVKMSVLLGPSTETNLVYDLGEKEKPLWGRIWPG